MQGVRHDVAGDRTGDVGARIAVLDNHRDGVAGRGIRGEADEQGVRAELPGQVERVEAVFPRVAANPHYLGASCLARHLDTGKPQPRRRGGAAGRIDHRPHALADQREVMLGQLHLGPVLGHSTGLHNTRARTRDMRADSPPGGDAGGKRRECQGRGEDEALADAADDRIPERPSLVVHPLVPGFGRHQPVLDIVHIHAEIGADAEALGHGGQRPNAGA
jgi:hypothetical protein